MKTRNSIKICWLTDCYVNKETKDNISAGSSSAGGESQSLLIDTQDSGQGPFTLLCAQQGLFIGSRKYPDCDGETKLV